MWPEEDSGFVEWPNGSGEGVFVSGHGVGRRDLCVQCSVPQPCRPWVCARAAPHPAHLSLLGGPEWRKTGGAGTPSPPPSAFIFPMPLLHFLEFCVVSKLVSKETFELTLQHARWNLPQKRLC